MKKTIVVLLTISLLVGGIIYAATSIGEEADEFYQRFCLKGKPHGFRAYICYLKILIDDLQEQIDNIELIPGPPGPQGPPGITGPSVKVFDATGREVGFLLEIMERMGNSQGFEVFDTNYHVAAAYNFFMGLPEGWRNFQTGSVSFTEQNCLGQAYVEELTNPYTLVHALDRNVYYAGNKDIGTVTNLSVQSRLYQNGSCGNVTYTASIATAVDEIVIDYIGPFSIATQ